MTDPNTYIDQATGEMPRPGFWRWLIGVNFTGKPLGWPRDRYTAWLVHNPRIVHW